MRGYLLIALLLLAPAGVLADEVDSALAAISAVGPEGQGHAKAIAAWKRLSRSKPADLPRILAGLDGANPLAANWIRAAIETIAEKALSANGKLPAKALEAFVLDREHSPRARRLAYEWLAKADPTASDRLIQGMADDPSVEFRRDAVARLIADAEKLPADDPAAKPIYGQALAAARDKDQIDDLAARLRKLGETVDLARHFGFVREWKLIGPFDNTDKKGFAVAYPPESNPDIDFSAAQQGKAGTVEWFEHASTEEYGVVDLNQAIGKNMGAVAYAAASFESDSDQVVDIRVVCTNAVKIWLNGKLIASHEVYHTGVTIDQYIARGELKAGPNTILLKVCQNEQTDEWAQKWQFQLRVCDATGTAILSRNRLAQRETAAGQANTPQ